MLVAYALAETSKRARATIAELGERFVRKGSTVLVHGHSRVAIAILRKAAAAVSPLLPAAAAACSSS